MFTKTAKAHGTFAHFGHIGVLFFVLLSPDFGQSFSLLKSPVRLFLTYQVVFDGGQLTKPLHVISHLTRLGERLSAPILACDFVFVRLVVDPKVSIDS